jgi:hypothetical protein
MMDSSILHHIEAACMADVLKDWIVGRVLLQRLFPVAARRQMDLRENYRDSFAVDSNVVADRRDESAPRRLIVDRIWNGFVCHCVSPMVK